MQNKIKQTLLKVFKKYRIVFWYDSKKELRKNYEKLELSDIEKIELNNNEFRVKHRILREEPNKKFLLYHEGEAPSDLDNWLLDVQLAYGEFRTDQSAIWLNELGLGIEFTDVVNEHAVFFNAVKRRERLKKILSADDTQNAGRIKMLAECAASDPRIDNILENLLSESTVKKDDKFKLIENCKLESFLWDRLPHEEATEQEVEEVLQFAIEGRKRVKDQLMKIDSTYAAVRFAYTKNDDGETVHVKSLEEEEYPQYFGFSEDEDAKSKTADQAPDIPQDPVAVSDNPPELEERPVIVKENQRGVTFDKLFSDYLQKARKITVTDSYIRLFYQIRNFMEFPETIVRIKPKDDEVHLITVEDEFKGPQQIENFIGSGSGCLPAL